MSKLVPDADTDAPATRAGDRAEAAPAASDTQPSDSASDLLFDDDEDQAASLADAPVSDTPLDQTLPGLWLVQQLAAGGMATVYFARDLRTGEPVAVKRVHPHLAAQSAFMRMFNDEASIAKRIVHDNVCRVIEHGVDRTRAPYLVLEYLHGAALDVCKRAMASKDAPLSLRERMAFAAHVIAAAADGLHAAHELQGADGASMRVVHRDVSPQNIVLCRDGGVKVVDFGVASATGRQQRTATGQLKGKIAYMAPEQVRMEGEVDRRADVWALGVVLWELLTGASLFPRKSEIHTLIAVLEAPIPLASSLAPDVPRELDAIVSRALERDADARYATARALAVDLRTWAADMGLGFGAADIGTWLGRALPALDVKHARLLSSPVSGPAPAGTEPASEEATRASTPPLLMPTGQMHVAAEVRDDYVAVVISGRMGSSADARKYQAVIERGLAGAGTRALLLDNRAGQGASNEAYDEMMRWHRDQSSCDRIAFLVESPSIVRGINLSASEYNVPTRAFRDLASAEAFLREGTATDTTTGRR